MAREIRDATDAAALIKKYWPQVEENTLQGYADFAWNLTSKNDFEAKLVRLSSALWDVYRSSDPLSNNRFTNALSNYAHSLHGFSNAFRTVLTGNATSFFNTLIKERCLWKDAINKRHGEYTHSIQWLAAGMDMGNHLSTLYAESAKLSKEKMSGRKSNETVSQREYLWTWLVDCRPNDKDPGNDDGDGIFSNSHRTQEITTRYCETMGESFLGYVLNFRAKNLTRGFQEMDDKSFNNYAINQHSSQESGWEAKTEPKQDNAIVGYQQHIERKSVHASRNGKVLIDKDKAKQTVTFHGKEGVIAMRNSFAI